MQRLFNFGLAQHRSRDNKFMPFMKSHILEIDNSTVVPFCLNAVDNFKILATAFMKSIINPTFLAKDVQRRYQKMIIN